MGETQSFEAIFCRAIEIEGEQERLEYLAEACGQNDELRSHVERLLKAHFSAGSFLEEPLPGDDEGRPTTLLNPTAQAHAIVAEVGPGSVFGHYKLLQQIGEGGMGVVFMAEQTEPVRRTVALKVIKAGMDSRQVIARFEVERQALALMDHHHIARVFDAGTTDQGRPYFVMELVKGVPITEYCDHNRLTLHERLELFIPVCHAIQHAHQKGIIHRDIKPSNVLVTLYDGRPAAKIIDFGIAKATNQRLTERTMFTELGQIVGTMEYMSPEQAEMNQLDVDTRSDVYSLGILLYELLTGSTPITKQQIRDAGYAEAMRAIREVEPPKPSTRLSDSGDALPSISAVRKTEPARLSQLLRGDLDWIAMKSLEKDRARRYETANGMAADIERFLRDDAIEARPPSAGYRLTKFARRNKALIGTLATVATILALASVVSAWWGIRAVRAERLANDRLGEVQNQREIAVANEAIAKNAQSEAEKSRDTALWNQYVARQYPIVDAWKRRDFGHLERMIAELVPQEGEPDFRGWEWTYFQDQCRNASSEFEGNLIAWRPTRQEFAVAVNQAGGGGSISIRSPNDRSISRTIVTIPREDSPSRITDICWSGSGELLAYATSTGKAVIIDVHTGHKAFEKQVHQGENWERLSVSCLDLSQDAETLVTSNWHGQIQSWDVESGDLVRVINDPISSDRNVSSIALCADGSQLAASFRAGQRMTWDMKTGEFFEYAPQLNTAGHVSWNAAGTHFAATERDAIYVYRLKEYEPVGKFAHQYCKVTRWIGDEQLIAGGNDQRLVIWNVADEVAVKEFHFHGSPISEIAVSHDEVFCGAASAASVKVFRLDTDRAAATILAPPEVQVGERHYLAWRSDGEQLASGLVRLRPHTHNIFTAPITVWDVVDETISLESEVGILRALAFGKDQEELLATTFWVRCNRIDIHSGNIEVQRNYLENPTSSVASFSHDVDYLLAHDDTHFRVVNTTNLDVVSAAAIPEYPFACKWSHDGARVAIASWTRVFIWSPFSTNQPRSVSVGKELTCLAWSVDGKTVAVGAADGNICCIRSDTLEIVKRLPGHMGKTRSIEWSSDGRRIASSSEDGTVRIWDSATADELLVFEHPYSRPFLTASWSPDASRLAAGDDRGVVFLWGSSNMPSLPPDAQGLATGELLLPTPLDHRD